MALQKGEGQMVEKEIKMLAKGVEEIDYREIKILQEDLKELAKEDLEKLKTRIRKVGFKYPIFVWKNKKIIYAIDGTERLKALASLEKDGWAIGPVAIIPVPAKSKKEAVEEIFHLSSRYGRMTEGGFFQLLDTMKLEGTEFDFENLGAIDIDLSVFQPELLDTDVTEPEIEEQPTENECPQCHYRW